MGKLDKLTCKVTDHIVLERGEEKVKVDIVVQEMSFEWASTNQKVVQQVLTTDLPSAEAVKKLMRGTSTITVDGEDVIDELCDAGIGVFKPVLDKWSAMFEEANQYMFGQKDEKKSEEK